MTRRTKIPLTRPPRGVGLVELMVGMTAGILLLGALSYLFLGSRQLNRTQDDVSRMQESGRVALAIVGRTLRQAGAGNATVPFAGDPVTGTEGASGAPDTLTVRYVAQEGGEVNCLGNPIAGGAMVTAVYAVDTANRTLTCTDGSGAAPVVVMDNIENMQVNYGVDTVDDNQAVIASYQTATGLTPSQVAAVRVSLLVAGPTGHTAATHTQTVTYDGASVSKTDGFLRQVFTSTYTARNKVK